MSSRPRTSVAVCGWGMASSLALDVVTSCAAARAGIRRTQEPTDFEAISLAGEEVVPTCHAAANDLTAGFEGKARLVLLLTEALADVARQTWPAEGAPPPDASLYLSLPDRDRVFSDLDLIASAPLRKSRQELATEATESTRPTLQTFAEELVDLSAPLLGWPKLPISHVSASGRPGFAEALAAALVDLESRPALTTAIVGGADSQLDPDTLTWLHETGRLKFSGNPVGIEPGEAAAFLVLQRGDRQQMPEKVLAWVGGAHTLKGPATPPGAALCKAMLAVQTTSALERIEWLLTDQDGTQEGAADVGNALVRLASQGGAMNPHISCPAIAFGDVGAATGAVMSCLAIAAWNRRWAPASAAFMTGSSRQQRAAHALLAPAGNP